MDKRQEKEEETRKSETLSGCNSSTQHLDVSSSNNELEQGEAKEEDYIRCSRCDQQVVGEMYHCANCPYYVHTSCIDLPQTLPTHPLHPHAALTLSLVAVDSSDSDSHYCFGCPKKFGTSFFGYKCTQTGCPRTLDVKCALSDLDVSGLHCHALEFYYVNERQQACNRKGTEKVNILIEDVTVKHCTVCELPLIGPINGCESCNFWIHKGCAPSPGVTDIRDIGRVEIPRDHHPRLHQEDHSLVFLSAPPFLNRCRACGTRVVRNTFHCNECNVDFHFGCATRKPSLQCGLIPDIHHPHDLTYFPDPAPFFRCSTCKGYSYKTPIYRCVECDFNLHKACIQFRPTVNNPDIHSCSLYLFEDFPMYMKLVCSVCHEAVNPNPGAYCCLVCHFFVHLQCVFIQTDNQDQDKQSRVTEGVVGNEPLVWSTIEDRGKRNINHRIDELQSKVTATMAKLNSEKRILMECWRLNKHITK